MNKFLIIAIIFSSLYSCSYQPLYTEKQYGFEFSNIVFDSDNKINKIIKNKLKEKSNSGYKYDIYFNSKKNKEIVLSNKKGDPEIYKLKIYFEYKILKDGKTIFEDNILEQVDYNNMTDKFELDKYEKNIINDLSDNFVNKLLVNIATLTNAK